MQIPVNKDLEEYKDDFFKGMTLRQTTMCALTVAAGVGNFFFFRLVLKLPQSICLYLVFPAALPFAVSGFLKIDGKSPFQYFLKRHQVISNPIYGYKPIAFSLMEEEEGGKQKLSDEKQNERNTDAYV